MLGEILCLLASVAFAHARPEESGDLEVENLFWCGSLIGCALADVSLVHIPPTMQPASPEEINVTFTLYARNNDKTDKANFTGKKIAFVTHGFTGDGQQIWVHGIKNVLLSKVDAVYIVDWSKGAAASLSGGYDQAASNTLIAGQEVAKFAKQLIANNGASASLMHGVGFSLGAHVMGVFGKHLPGLGRITGLDPARPCFEIEGNDKHQLAVTDAQLVDIVHTTHTKWGAWGIGYRKPAGHTDFFLKTGWFGNQPGCWDRRCDSGERNDTCPDTGPARMADFFCSGAPDKLEPKLACSHGYAYQIYIQSFEVRGHAYGCREDGRVCAPFGYDVFTAPERGTFELETTAGPPYFVIIKP